MFYNVQHSPCESNEVEVETASSDTDVPDGIEGHAAERDQADIDCVLDAKGDDTNTDGEAKPTSGKDAVIQGQDGDHGEELHYSVKYLADPVYLQQRDGVGRIHIPDMSTKS